MYISVYDFKKPRVGSKSTDADFNHHHNCHGGTTYIYIYTVYRWWNSTHLTKVNMGILHFFSHLKPPTRNGFLWLFSCIWRIQDETYFKSRVTCWDWNTPFHQHRPHGFPRFGWKTKPRKQRRKPSLWYTATVHPIGSQVPGTSKRGEDLVSKFNVIFWNISA